MKRNSIASSWLLCAAIACLPPALAQDAAGAKPTAPAPQHGHDQAQLEREVAAWHRASGEAMQSHLRSVAARGDARSLLAASLLWNPGTFEMLPAQQASAAIAQETRAWFDAARSIQPRDPLVAWIEASGCQGLSERCDRASAIAFLLQSEADNAAVHLLAMAAAEQRGDAKAVALHWRGAASATAYDVYAVDIGRLLLDATRDAKQPPMSQAVAEALGAGLAVGRGMKPQEMNAILAMATHSAVALPALLPITRHCKPETLASGPIEQAARCEHVLGLMADDESFLLGPMIGLGHMVRITGDSAEGRQWRERLRQFSWTYENALQRLPGAPGGGDMDEYATWYMTEGELTAMRRLLERENVAAEPPAGWLPSDPRYRALVTTGREPAG